MGEHGVFGPAAQGRVKINDVMLEDRAAVLFASHDFDQQLFKKSNIPGIRDLPVTLSVHGGAFWTSFVEHEPNPGDDMIPTAATP